MIRFDGFTNIEGVKYIHDKGNIVLFLGECIDIMSRIPSGSVDLIFTDLPYGITQNKWDSIIPLKDLWECFNNVIKKPNGVIALTAVQPFSSILVTSNIKNFKYEVIWEKTIGSGQLNIKHQPLRVHESVLIFYDKIPTYNEQKTKGKPYKIDRKVNSKGEGYGKQSNSRKVNDGFRHAKSIINVPNPRVKGGHPTQKPISLMDHFIRTFTNRGDTVLDCCCGSGTTLVSSYNLGRKCIGIENNKKYFNMSVKRILDKCV